MKLNEFKAWFEGFTEDMERAPTAKQWKRIKERVGEIDGVAISYPVYIDRYVRPYFPTIYPYVVGCGGVSSAVVNLTGVSSMQASNCIDGDATSIPYFDGATAMYAAGKAEADALTAS